MGLQYFCGLYVSCEYESEFCTSPTLVTYNRGAKPFEVNQRMIMAFRAIGKGMEALKTFTLHMNMSEPMARKITMLFLSPLKATFHSEAGESMSNAVKVLQSNGREYAVSVDGT